MAKITSVEILHVDLPPPVPRSDAIQSFVTQETPIVRIASDDGLEGTGYSYTIGTGGSSVIALLRDHLAPRLIGRDPAMVEQLWRELLFAGDRLFRWQAVLPIMTPVLLIGGMTTGLFTPTEGAIAACVWAMFLGLVWYRTLSWKMFVKVCLDTVETTATVMFIVAAASIFGWMLTATGVTSALSAWVLGFTKEAWVFLLLANALMLFVGCFLEPTAAITILVPLLLPIARQLGVDPVHFGLVMVLNLMIGLLHPPMGMVLFVLARVAKLSLERTTMAILPWLVPLLLSLVVITYVPAIVLWLPKLVM